MSYDDLNLTTTIARMTAVVALVVTILLPGVYFSIRYTAIAASVNTEAAIQANSIIQMVVSTPEMWKYQEHRLQEQLQRNLKSLEVESAHPG